jgi:hypothetical protein
MADSVETTGTNQTDIDTATTDLTSTHDQQATD